MTFGTTGLIGFGAGGVGLTLMDVLSSLGLTTNLKLCLDAGDAQSYPGSGQKWLDRSGNGTDFFLGSDNTASGSDPTFNGAAGAVSAGEYFSFDGGDYFTYDTTNEAWMNTLHKDSALWSIVAAYYLAGGGGYLFGTDDESGGGGSGIGVNLGLSSTLGFRACNNSGSPPLTVSSSTATLNSTAWNIVGVSVNEAAGAGASRWFANGVHETFNGTYVSPSAGSATRTMQIGARGNGNGPFADTSRLAWVAMFQGVALDQTDFDKIFAVTRGRFGL